MIKNVERLAINLRSRWLEEMQWTRQRFHASQDIDQLKAFVEEAATESSDPMYGQLIYSPHERRPKVKRSTHHQKGDSLHTAHQSTHLMKGGSTTHVRETGKEMV